MKKNTFRFWFFLAVIADGLSLFVPFVGSIFIGLAALTFSIKRYGGGKMISVLGTAMIEAIPGLSIMPSCMWYVWRRYVANKIATRKEPDQKGQSQEQIFEPTYS